MMLPRTPSFWQEISPISALLLPFAALYGIGRTLHVAASKPQRAAIPVVCVGNLIAGGAGKTPLTISLATMLKEEGVEVHIVTRGYGSNARGVHKVNTKADTVDTVGDEALLLARHAPCWVAPRRIEGVNAAAEAGAKLVLLDDGLQHPHIHKNLSLLVMDGSYGIGNGWLLPAGPLRDTVAAGKRMTDALVIVGEDTAGIRKKFAGLPAYQAMLQPQGELAIWQRRKCVAFAGIARPEKFFSTLRTLGAELSTTIPFADHHRFTEDELKQLHARAQAEGAELVTTEKDWVRLPPEERAKIHTLPVALQWEGKPQQLIDEIRSLL